MGILYADAALYALLAWYFDNVISSNRGRGDSFLFPIHRILKLIRGSKIVNNPKVFKGLGFGDGADESSIK
jgi:hypothetical protein